MAAAYIQNLISEQPDLTEHLLSLQDLHTRRLWHQLTLKLEACFQIAQFNQGDLPSSIFQSFILDFAHKINILKLAHFAVSLLTSTDGTALSINGVGIDFKLAQFPGIQVHASKYQPSPSQSIDLLNSVIAKIVEMKVARSAEPVLFLKMHVAQFKLETGVVPDAKQLVEAGREELDRLSDVDPSVSAAVHYVASLYFKAIANYAEFYRSTLMYLSFVSSESLPEVSSHACSKFSLLSRMEDSCSEGCYGCSGVQGAHGRGRLPGGAAGREHLQLWAAAAAPARGSPRQRAAPVVA